MTARPRRTRKKALKHGDLFHVYIASDTPPEVCEFLSRLKQNGDFSYEILQIIGNHVEAMQNTGPLAQLNAVAPKAVETADTSSTAPVHVAAAQAAPKTPQVPSQAAAVAPRTPVEAPSQSPEPDPEPVAEERVEPQPKLDPIALLRQQRRAWVASSSSH
ncbi:hypothetical protein NZD89_27490 [Alicyclobacillus fastidiosus]|uniref:Uncharacterized protein n=1 Tax=Alicyclobacillus fastidiosus TaxID=392011 RepID=A0ABY6ZG66_9BACL|nr:hypothetical protein [Alicyclobacillus fastidiosus]WAH41899.1 hypothetical protein NZD89_27490 [Alicyclobacillus fastidiosus]GMA63611.1 hypothetical protein GCM10025859_40510 [Alicyclobacillus fastidiosus]